MFYPQGNFYPQGSFGAQGNFNSAQGNFNPQGGFGPQGFQGNPGNIPFSNTPYGYPQQTPIFAQSPPQLPNWQYPAHQAAQQQLAIQQLLAHQLATQQLATPHLSGTNGINGGAQIAGAWTQPQQQQPAHHLLQKLAQYHYLVAQQLAQLAAQQAVQSSGNPYASQFIPGQLGANFVPGITMH